MSNITITGKGKYYESSCGAWSKEGMVWLEGGVIISLTNQNSCRIQTLRTAFKQQILDGQAGEVEPEVFTGDPSEWGEGVYRAKRKSYFAYIVVDSAGSCFRIDSDGDVITTGPKSPEALKYTRISTNPADIISDKVKGVTA